MSLEEQLVKACRKSVGTHNEDQYKLYLNLIKEGE